MEVIGNTPAEFAAVIAAETPQWAKVIRDAAEASKACGLIHRTSRLPLLDDRNMRGAAVRGSTPVSRGSSSDFDLAPEGTEAGAHDRTRARPGDRNVQVWTQNRRTGRDHARAIARFISQRPAPDADERRRRGRRSSARIRRRHGNRARAVRLLPRPPSATIHLDLRIVDDRAQAPRRTSRAARTRASPRRRGGRARETTRGRAVSTCRSDSAQIRPLRTRRRPREHFERGDDRGDLAGRHFRD